MIINPKYDIHLITLFAENTMDWFLSTDRSTLNKVDFAIHCVSIRGKQVINVGDTTAMITMSVPQWDAGMDSHWSVKPKQVTSADMPYLWINTKDGNMYWHSGNFAHRSLSPDYSIHPYYCAQLNTNFSKMLVRQSSASVSKERAISAQLNGDGLTLQPQFLSLI